MRRAPLLFFAAFLLAAAVEAQSPSAEWRTIETAHFRVHYPAPFEAWAKRAASRIESVHSRVTEYVGYTPGRRVEVLVSDPVADANGLAFPFLDRPVIVLWTSPPEAESAVGYYNDWTEVLLTHEMTHIVHLVRPRNRSRGILSRLAPIPIGPILRKAPPWVTEGYATMVEGALTGSGRPHGTFRAMVIRRFAMEGTLPEYGALSSAAVWLGDSMPYLVGSTFLEWLEAREGEGSLRKLWKRLASRRGGKFSDAFRGVFGKPPADLYNRFRAEMTARAIAEEKRLTEAGLAEGELWQRLAGGTLSTQVSPDGARLLARRVPKPGRGFLAVWEIEPSRKECEAGERRRKEEEELLRDPEEVADRVEEPRPREPHWTLPNVNGHSATDPRWMPDGKGVLFVRKAPDADGVLHPDLYVWEPEAGRTRRVTEKADVSMADPSPDGSFFVGVQNRHGITRLVRIDAVTGRAVPLSEELDLGDPWRVWIHPRISPDGSRVAALVHSAPSWRLMVLGTRGEDARQVPLSGGGAPAGPPAWSPDGSRIYITTDALGVWNIESVDPAGLGTSRTLTRVTGGALAPAPHPDGKSLFFAAASAKGMDLRRLSLAPSEIRSLPPAIETSPILPPRVVPLSRPAESRVSEPLPYGLFQSHILRPSLANSFGPDGATLQVGLEGSDVLGRLNWVAAGSIGDSAGPRGGSVSFAYRGLPLEVRGQVFWALEKPGSQRVVRRREFDMERLGGAIGLSWSRAFLGGSVGLDAGAGSTRVEEESSAEKFDRSVAALRAAAKIERTRGRKGLGLDAAVTGSSGRTRGDSWSQLLASAGVSAILPLARLRLAGSLGETGGTPSKFDLFAVGGAASSILPPVLDRNQFDSPALPGYAQTGERLEALRAEISLRSLPVTAYTERLRAFRESDEKPDPIEVTGIELRIDERILPLNRLGSFDFYAGVAKIKSRAPRFDSTRGYAGVIYRP